MDNQVNLNINFQEAYKRLDRLCKDCFAGNDGVSEYIRQLENEQWKLRKYNLWQDDDYKMLKHVRWIRNKLSHEVDTFQSDLCTQDDLDFVIDFYNDIMDCLDPLAQLYKFEENEKKQKQKINTTSKPKEYDQTKKDKKKSIFAKFIEKIKKLFS